jgi:hypothetical protein
MEFKTEAQRNTYDTVVKFAKELFGEANLRFPDESPVIILDYPGTSTLVFISIYPWRDDSSVIEARGLVTRGTELAPDLLLYLLKENIDFRFGGFAVDGDGDIWFLHSIVGPTCDKEELKATVSAVVATADKFDDEIVARWGGRRLVDH